MVQYDWARVAFVAVMAASLTTALKIGSLAPMFRDVTRSNAPRKFWVGIGCYSFFVVGFFVGVLLVLLGWLR